MQLSPSSNWYFFILFGAVIVALALSLVFEFWTASLVFAFLIVPFVVLLIYRWARQGEIERFTARWRGRSY